MIIYNVIITVLLIASFLMCLKAFTIGLKWGAKLERGQVPTLHITSNDNKTTAQEPQLQQELDNIFGYNADIATNTIKKGG